MISKCVIKIPVNGVEFTGVAAVVVAGTGVVAKTAIKIENM